MTLERLGLVRRTSNTTTDIRYGQSKRKDPDTNALIDQIEFQYKKGNYYNLSLHEMDSLLHRGRLFYEINPEDTSLPAEFMLYLKKYLGNLVRSQGDGTILGQRALDEQKVRSANLVCHSQCEFITLGVTDYITMVKANAKEKRNQKFRMIYNVFKGTDALNYEYFWQFQYLFTQGSCQEGSFLAEDTKKNNRIFLIEEGACEIIKIKTRNTMAHFDSAINDLEEVAKKDAELMEALMQLRFQLDSMSDGASYHMGFIGEGQIANLEGLFSTTGSSFFSYKVKYSELKYFEINPYIQKMVVFKGEIQKNSLELLKTILFYRIKMLSNKNYFEKPGTEPDFRVVEVEKFAQPIHLTKKLKEDRLVPCIDLVSGPSSHQSSIIIHDSNAGQRMGSVEGLLKHSSKEGNSILKASRMLWKLKSQKAVSREATISAELKKSVTHEYFGAPSVLKFKPKASVFTNLFQPSRKSKHPKKESLIKMVQKECTFDFAKRRKTDLLMTGAAPTTEATASTDIRRDSSPLTFRPAGKHQEPSLSARLPLSRKTSAPHFAEWSPTADPSGDTLAARSVLHRPGFGARGHRLASARQSASSTRVCRPLTAVGKRSGPEINGVFGVGASNGKLGFIVKKTGYSELVASQCFKTNSLIKNAK